ncbi:MAG: IS256 family transposase, partial [Nitrosospira sp.]
TNPIESTFATVRLRTAKTRGCVSRTRILSMVFKLARSAEQHWLLLRGSDMIIRLVANTRFKNGVITETENHQRAAG